MTTEDESRDPVPRIAHVGPPERPSFLTRSSSKGPHLSPLLPQPDLSPRPAKKSPFFPILLILGGTSTLAMVGLCLVTSVFLGATGFLHMKSQPQAASDGPLKKKPTNIFTTVKGTTHGGGRWRFSVPKSWEEVTGLAKAPSDPGSKQGHAAKELKTGVIRALRAKVATDDFYPNVNLYTEVFHGSSESYYEHSLISMRSFADIRSHGQVDPLPAFEIEARWPKGETPTYTLQRLISDGTHGYTLTCSTAIGAFEKSRALCERITSSFLVDDSN